MSFLAFAQDPVANTIAVIVLILMIASALSVIYYFIKGKADNRLFRWPWLSIPVLSVVGFVVALYLSYVEITKSEAICGPIGNCNDVQSSPFAYLFGIIPIGLIGLVGYITILVTWLVLQFGPQSLRKISTLGIWAMAWFGIVFSIYLTFLEPFVIGATCVWCITSALVITLIFWASSGPAIESLQIGSDLIDTETELDSD